MENERSVMFLHSTITQLIVVHDQKALFLFLQTLDFKKSFPDFPCINNSILFSTGK